MTPGKVLSTYYTIAGLYTLAAALIWGVNTLFLLDAGLDIFEVFVANAAFTAGSVVFEIPTGVLADTGGRRLSFLLSVGILLLTTVAYVAVAAFGGGVLVFSLVSVVMGLGFTFYSGATEAWLVDALEATGFRGSLDRVFARGAMVTGAAMLLGTVGGGALGSLNLALPYLLRAALLGLVLAVAAATMRDLGFTPRALRLRQWPGEMRQVARMSMTHGWHQPSIRLMMGYSAVSWGFMTWAYYAWQPYFLALLGRDAVWVAGVVAALISLSMIFGNAVVDWVSRFCGKRSTLLLWAAGIQTCAAVAVGLAESFWVAVALFMVVTASLGVVGPVKQAYLHRLIPGDKRASVVSLDAMFGNAGGVLGQGGLGYLSRARSIPDAFVIGGLATLLALPVLALLRSRQDSADIFVGERAAERGTCAPAGIPPVSQLDAREAP